MAAARRILAIVPGFARQLDDATIPALRTLLLAEAASGADVRVLALRHPPGPSRYRIGAIEVETLGAGKVRGVARLSMLWRAVAAGLRAAQTADPATEVWGFWADEPGFVAVEVGKRLGLPVTVSLMGGELANLPALGYGVGQERLGRWLRDHALRGADVVTVGSKFLHARALEAGLPRDRLQVRPLPLDAARFAPNRRRPRATGLPLRIGVLANLVPVKQHALLLRAVARLAAEGQAIQLDFCGDGPLRAALAAQAETLGLGSALFLRGALPWSQVPAWLAEIDLHVLPSAWESQGMATLEAAAAGVAVAGSRVGALPEISAAVALWAPDDEAEICRGLRHLARRAAREPGWLGRAGEAARAEVIAAGAESRVVASSPV